jgi:hypothetical protein
MMAATQLDTGRNDDYSPDQLGPVHADCRTQKPFLSVLKHAMHAAPASITAVVVVTERRPTWSSRPVRLLRTRLADNQSPTIHHLAPLDPQTALNTIATDGCRRWAPWPGCG